jgi:hypothetical protein
MWQSLWARILSELFGDGLGADIASRGAVYLADEARKAVDREPERLTGVRLRPGESFTVVARPPATKEQRKLAAAERKLRARDEQLNRPTRKQLRAARALRYAQRKVDRRSPGGRRHARAVAEEAAAGARFDKVMTPTRKQASVHAALLDTTGRLDASREASMQRVRGGSTRRAYRSRHPHIHVYD